MPTKKNVSQKQRQKQSVTVNISLAKAKARAKSSAKKSGKGGSRGSIMMLPPPIYASPLDRLTPGMYNSQGQQIQQRSMEELLKGFLSNQQNQQVGSFKTLGTAPGSSSVSYNPNKSGVDAKEFQNEVLKKLSPEEQKQREKAKKNIEKMYQDILRKRESESNIPTPFQNEERSYLKASEPDYDAPQFSQNEARVSQGNIYESLKKQEPPVYDTIRKLEESLAKDEELINFSKQSLGDYNTPLSFPGMYGPRVPVNKSKQEDYFKQYYD
jgi:hypothetical protein